MTPWYWFEALTPFLSTGTSTNGVRSRHRISASPTFDRLLKSGVAALALTAAGAGLALAQQPTTTLEQVVVEGGAGTADAATGPVEGYVAKQTATGSKTGCSATSIRR